MGLLLYTLIKTSFHILNPMEKVNKSSTTKQGDYMTVTRAGGGGKWGDHV